MKDAVAAKVAEIAERVGRDEGVEIFDVEFAGSGAHRLLRIYIDKPEGVSHADCQAISEHVGTILDVEDVVPGGRYTLEVSSPGVERKLVKPRDFERFTGNRIRVVLREPIEGQRHWEGTLAGFADGVIRLEPSRGKPVSFALEQVQRANLKFEW